MQIAFRFSRVVIQVLFFIAVWLLSNQLVKHSGIPVPAGVVGLAVVAGLLFFGVLPTRYVQSGANWLLAEMLLFFIPPIVGITTFGPTIMHQGLKILTVLVLGCLIVMAGTGWVVDSVFSFEHRRNQRSLAGDQEL